MERTITERMAVINIEIKTLLPIIFTTFCIFHLNVLIDEKGKQIPLPRYPLIQSNSINIIPNLLLAN